MVKESWKDGSAKARARAEGKKTWQLAYAHMDTGFKIGGQKRLRARDRDQSTHTKDYFNIKRVREDEREMDERAGGTISKKMEAVREQRVGGKRQR
jgi:hypothetical protein